MRVEYLELTKQSHAFLLKEFKKFKKKNLKPGQENQFGIFANIHLINNEVTAKIVTIKEFRTIQKTLTKLKMVKKRKVL